MDCTATRAVAEMPRAPPTGEAAERAGAPLGTRSGRRGEKPREGQPLSRSTIPVAPPCRVAARAPPPPLLTAPASCTALPMLRAPELLQSASSTQAQRLSPLTLQLPEPSLYSAPMLPLACMAQPCLQWIGKLSCHLAGSPMATVCERNPEIKRCSAPEALKCSRELWTWKRCQEVAGARHGGIRYHTVPQSQLGLGKPEGHFLLIGSQYPNRGKSRYHALIDPREDTSIDSLVSVSISAYDLISFWKQIK